MYVDNLKLS